MVLLRRILGWVATGTALTLMMVGFVAPPRAAAVDIYTTEGIHEVNGRTWRTQCSQYSSSVRRCRTDIIATTVVAAPAGFVSQTGWVFNNLTYLPSPRGQWSGNPLATHGTHTIDGRQWRTECDTPATGRNGCRSYILARVVAVVGTNPTRYAWTSQWTFNNIVQFSQQSVPVVPQPPNCNGAPHPAGFRMGPDGRPSPPGRGQIPGNSYHAQYIGNYIRTAMKDTRTTQSQKKCLAIKAGKHLIDGSTTRVVDGVTSRWFPYDFDFRANPTVNTLRAPWYSGITQANALTLSILMADITGDPVWTRYGREVFESFMVRHEDGGFTSREKGFLWFELYRTSPGTSVLNGHFQALIALSAWGETMNEPRAQALVDESLAELDTLLAASEVEVEAGVMGSYELLRGYPAAPLRLVASPGFRVDGTLLNGAPQPIATVKSASPPAPNVLLNSDMTATNGGIPTHWRPRESRSNVTVRDGAVRFVTDGSRWQGVSQSIPAGTFQPGEELNLRARARLTVPEGAPGNSAKVMARQWCSGKDTTLLTTTKTRSDSWTSYDFGFSAPRAGCSLEIILTSANEGPAGSIIEFDDVELSRADVVGPATTPDYDLRVDETPVNTLTFRGSGAATLQAHADGRWQDIGHISLTAGTPASLIVPERHTGRNLHYGYHEGHVAELMLLHKLTGDPLFLDYARRWVPLAPLYNATVPRSDARMVATLDPLSEVPSEMLVLPGSEAHEAKAPESE